MINEIKNKLLEIELNDKVQILYACESGSRAWGFPSPDSDYDVRFIYRHEVDWYLSIKERKDVIEKPVNEVFDVGGWDLKKALVLIAKSNAVVWEWLQSPIVYAEREAFHNRLLPMIKNYYSLKSCCFHYLSIAKNTMDLHFQTEKIKVKKYFYILRPLFAAKWICDRQGIPPMNFHELMKGLDVKPAISGQIENLLILKEQMNEKDAIDRINELDEFILKSFEKYNIEVNQLPVAKEKVTALDHFFKSMVLPI